MRQVVAVIVNTDDSATHTAIIAARVRCAILTAIKTNAAAAAPNTALSLQNRDRYVIDPATKSAHARPKIDIGSWGNLWYLAIANHDATLSYELARNSQTV